MEFALECSLEMAIYLFLTYFTQIGIGYRGGVRRCVFMAEKHFFLRQKRLYFINVALNQPNSSAH